MKYKGFSWGEGTVFILFQVWNLIETGLAASKGIMPYCVSKKTEVSSSITCKFQFIRQLIRYNQAIILTLYLSTQG